MKSARARGASFRKRDRRKRQQPKADLSGTAREVLHYPAHQRIKSPTKRNFTPNAPIKEQTSEFRSAGRKNYVLALSEGRETNGRTTSKRVKCKKFAIRKMLKE